MYTANSPKELKKMLEEGKSPIYTTDSKTIKVVEALESIKSKGVVGTAKDEIKKMFLRILTGMTKPMGIISDTTILIIVGMSLTALVSLYALYKEKNPQIEYEEDVKGKRRIKIEIR